MFKHGAALRVFSILITALSFRVHSAHRVASSQRHAIPL